MSKDLTGLTNLEKDHYMKFFDNSDITSECFLCHRNANSHPCTFLQLIHGNQTNIFRTRAAYIFQNFIMKMQMLLFKNILFTQIKKQKVKMHYLTLEEYIIFTQQTEDQHIQ